VELVLLVQRGAVDEDLFFPDLDLVAGQSDRKSPTRRFGSMEPVGIWKAWTTKVMTKKTKTAVSARSSKYSRKIRFSFFSFSSFFLVMASSVESKCFLHLSGKPRNNQEQYSSAAAAPSLRDRPRGIVV
jgi:hypothetical protein